MASRSPVKAKSTQVKPSTIMTKASASKVHEKETIALVGDEWEEF
jgi:hypothetical protein